LISYQVVVGQILGLSTI